MATEKGVVQGCTAGAAVNAEQQIIVNAEAHGTGSEQELLLPVVDALAALRTSDTVLTADAGYHSEANLASLAACEVPALIAENERAIPECTRPVVQRATKASRMSSVAAFLFSQSGRAAANAA